MTSSCVFDDHRFCNSHSVSLLANNIAGGKSYITPAMRMALDVIASDPESPIFGKDLDTLVNNRQINMFERDAHGLPLLENYVVMAMLRSTSKVVPTVRCYGTNNEEFVMSTEDYVNNELYVTPESIYLQNPDNHDIYKYGKLVAIDFTDGHGVSQTRFVETFDNVQLNFNIDAMVENDRWHVIWRAARSCGIGAARHHGYGNFIATRWERAN